MNEASTRRSVIPKSTLVPISIYLIDVSTKQLIATSIFERIRISIASYLNDSNSKDMKVN